MESENTNKQKKYHLGMNLSNSATIIRDISFFSVNIFKYFD